MEAIVLNITNKQQKRNITVNVLRSYRIPEQICKQVIDTKSFKSTETKPKFNMFLNTNRKSKWVLHLLESNLCKIHCNGKSEGSFNFRLNSRRKAGEHVNLQR